MTILYLSGCCLLLEECWHDSSAVLLVLLLWTHRLKTSQLTHTDRSYKLMNNIQSRKSFWGICTWRKFFFYELVGLDSFFFLSFKKHKDRLDIHHRCLYTQRNFFFKQNKAKKGLEIICFSWCFSQSSTNNYIKIAKNKLPRISSLPFCRGVVTNCRGRVHRVLHTTWDPATNHSPVVHWLK